MPTKAIKQQYQGQYTKWAITALVILGLLSILIRILFSEQIRLTEGDTIWTISINTKIENLNKGDTISISPPWNTSHIRLVSQEIQHTGLRQIRVKGDSLKKRAIVLRALHSGNVSPQLEFNVHISKTQQPYFVPTTKPLDEEKRSLYLSSEANIDLADPVISRVYNVVSQGLSSADDRLDNIYRYVKNNITQSRNTATDNAAVALKTGRATTLGRARAMVALCRSASIPARIVTGFMLEEDYEISPYHWVEIYKDDNWIPYDPEKGYAGNLPANYLAFNRGEETIIKLPEPDNLQVSYHIERNYDFSGLNIHTEKRLLDIFDLNRFSPEARINIGLLLLLPLGALITAFSRNFLGIRGYGTFTPTLLALAAVYADWVAALVLLTVVVALGMSGRSAMPDKLLRIPRLAIMMTIVIMSMTLGVSLMEYFNINPGEHIVLLPIVILTTLLDRFYSTAEDYGLDIAIKRLFWTIIISLVCYPVLKMQPLGAVLLTYPEAHFITLSLILIISGYKGKQLTDFPAFKWIKEPERAKRKRSQKQEQEEL